MAFKLEYATTRMGESGPGFERSLLRIYTDRRISEGEANDLLRKVADHKWFVSEKLNRDVGFHVAAIDYVENFYRPPAVTGRAGELRSYVSRMVKMVSSAAIKYLTAKGRPLSF